MQEPSDLEPVLESVIDVHEKNLIEILGGVGKDCCQPVLLLTGYSLNKLLQCMQK